MQMVREFLFVGSQSDEFVIGLLRDYLADGISVLGEISAAAEKCDSQAFQDLVHSLRSSTANVGATKVFDLCINLRNVGREELEERGTAHVAALRQEFERARDAFEAYMESLVQPSSTVVTTLHPRSDSSGAVSS